MGLCDFCNEPDPVWVYPAHDILMVPTDDEEPVHQSVGGWAACDTCSTLIERRDTDGLLVRALGRAHELGLPTEKVLPDLRELFVAFFEARTGSRGLL